MINLQKGQKISLTKENDGLKNVMVGLGWDEIKKESVRFSLFSKKPRTADNNIDCDTAAILLDANGKCLSNNDVVYFGSLVHNSNAVVHQGDNLTGAGDGDDEQILVDLENLPLKYNKIVFIVNIYKADERHQHFGMIQNAFIRIVDTSNSKEICRFNLSNDVTYNDKTSMIFGELYRHNNEWKFNAIGEGLYEVGISKVVQLYR